MDQQKQKVNNEELLKQQEQALVEYQKLADKLFMYCQLYQEKMIQIKQIKEGIEKTKELIKSEKPTESKS